MLWIKAFHIVFVASWFAGMFYLPRIFVNLAMVSPESLAERERLLLMARKLYRFSNILMGLSLVLGLWLWMGYLPYKDLWMHLKLTLVLGAMAYHFYSGHLLRTFERGHQTRSHVWFRVFNEVSVLIFAAITVLVVVKQPVLG